MDEPEILSPGLLGSFRKFGTTLMTSVQTRFELFGIELAEEKQRLLTTLAWSAALLFFGMLTVITLTFAIVIACPEKSRPYVLGAFCLLYLVLAVVAAFGVRRQIKDRPPPFSTSLGELKKDADWLRSQS